MTINEHDLRYALAKLAQRSLWMEHHGQSDILIRVFIARLADGSDRPDEVNKAWDDALAAATKHHTDIVPKINAIREEFGTKHIIG